MPGGQIHQKTLGVGLKNISGITATYFVTTIQDLIEKVIPHFDQYP